MALPYELTGPVLLLEPHGVDSHPNALAQRGIVVEVPGGARIIDVDNAPSIGRHEFQFVASRAETAFLEEFFDARQGRAEGFWFANTQWEFDFRGYEFNAPSSYALYVERWGYCERFFPLGAAYRQIAILYGDRWVRHTVDSVIASVAPGIDRLHMALGPASDPAPPLIASVTPTRDDRYRTLWLRYGRFDQDELVAELLNGEGYCRIDVAIVETPADV